MKKLLKDINSNVTETSNVRYFFHFIGKVLLYSIFTLVTLLVTIFIIYFIDKVYNEKSNTGRPPLFNAYVIVSPSMVPTIKINDAVVVVRYNPKKLKVRDIITFSSTDPSYSGMVVTHRIVAKDTSNDGKCVFTTKGDHNNVEDPTLVTEGSLYGKVILKIPKIGYIRSFLTTTTGFLLFVLVPSLVIIILDIVKLLKKIKMYFLLSSSYKDNNIEVNNREKDNNSDIEVL